MHFIYTQIYNNYKSGNHRKAKDLFHEILPILAFSNQHLDISIHFFKKLLYKQGLYTTSKVREPIGQFDEIHKKIANSLIAQVIQLEKKLR